MRQWRYSLKMSLLFALSTSTLFSFQNCASEFETAEQLESIAADSISSAPVTCSLPNGSQISPGQSVTGFPIMSALYPVTCGAQVQRNCLNTGLFDGSVPVYQNCQQQCINPDNNQAVNSGSQFVYFTRASGATQAECDAARVVSTCQQASGMFLPAVAANRFPSCLVQGQTCAYTTSAGAAVPSGNAIGSTVSGFVSQTATFPNLCGSSVNRTCQASGQWTGSVPLFSSCTQKCIHPDTAQPVDAMVQYIYYTRAQGTTAECAAARVVSSCQQATGLFSPNVVATRFSTCQIQDPPADKYAPDNGPVVSASARVVNVSTSAQLLSALSQALPGDHILLGAGNYRLTDSKVRVNRAGSSGSPIFLRASQLGQATIEFCNPEGFYVTASNWVFENLVVRGVCGDGTNNEHAFHIVGGGSDTVLRNNKVVNFMSHVKTNCDIVGTVFNCPSGIKFINNRWFNDKAMPGNSPFNVLNIDGSPNTVVRGNLFYDFASANTSRSATAIYPKMHSDNVLVEQNFIVCEKNVVTGSNRRGINVGDSTDGNQFCKDTDCTSFNGIFRNNVVINCQGAGNSFGIGVINQDTTQYLNNTTINVKQNWFDQTAPVATNLFKNNLFSQGWASQIAGRVPLLQQNYTLTRNDGMDLLQNPRSGQFQLLSSPVPSVLSVTPDATAAFDFCGNRRGSVTSVGAIDYHHPSAADCVNRMSQLYQMMILD